MFTHIELNSFKSFVSAYIELKPLTILTGLNSSGKSSILQALRMWQLGDMLQGHGDVSAFASVHSADGGFAIHVGSDLGADIIFCPLEYSPGEGVQRIVGDEYTPYTGGLIYINAARLGPQVNTPLRPGGSCQTAGEYGEYIVDYLMAHRELAGVPESLRLDDDKLLSGVYENIGKWLSVISPGATFDPHAVKEADIGWLEFYNRRPTNVGFGLSYALPVIATVVIESAKYAASLPESDNSPRPAILIENPEAHLHPRGQTQIGKLLALAASAGVQCIVETHSDHFINGARLAVKSGQLDEDDVVCQYFTFDAHEEKSSVDTIYIDEHGMFDHWPVGFCDETEVNLLKLV